MKTIFAAIFLSLASAAYSSPVMVFGLGTHSAHATVEDHQVIAIVGAKQAAQEDAEIKCQSDVSQSGRWGVNTKKIRSPYDTEYVLHAHAGSWFHCLKREE